ncbi:MAG: NTP transferase domain-containing protein [Actinobacteria bacterium]|jgi:CTP:molybdopterin cytidylyltransferase MocA|uniref:Unannotated protein n=1 Tax=freshwater metagenome TaxID=449393 RepID=A0A6J7TBP1_9ZZZZ|nr:NTP transferase domain-containing protein [Actinomycetota bacterium]MSZ80878.1 NTP transferase domain-containing protein [Actinomycetota bacterium]MTB12724.1 NTP transferase domain-containing protein [Actinomycetota bacterium]
MNAPHRKTLGVLLGAGAGTRFLGAEHKLLTAVDGDAIIAQSLLAMTTSGLDSYIAISGAVDISSFLNDVEEVHNPDWKTGQRSSVLVAMQYARTHGFDSIVVGLADQPFISSDNWRAVAASSSPIAIATFNGIRGNPVRLHSSTWDAFENLDSEPDEGARSLIRMHPELVREVACEGNSADIDTTEDLDQWT